MNGNNGSLSGAGSATPIANPEVLGGNTVQVYRSTTNPFTKAVKYNAKGRIALIGPAGGGKTFTALMMARALAGLTGKIAAQDTEHGSMSKYADLFDFDVLELDSFSPEVFIANLHAAEEAGYSVFLTDSLSHFWVGKDGAFDFVDMAQARQRDQMTGWKAFRPHERKMVDAMIASPMHIICTLRTKNDYVNVTDANGKTKRVKVGLAPVQREGLEYEFDLVGYIDEENTLSIDKTRCPSYSQKAFAKPGQADFAPFVEWLKGAIREPRIAPPAPDTGGHPMGTAEAAAFVAQSKIEELKTSGEAIRALNALREPLGEFHWLGVLSTFGVHAPDKFRNMADARSCYKKMLAKLEEVDPAARENLRKAVA